MHSTNVLGHSIEMTIFLRFSDVILNPDGRFADRRGPLVSSGPAAHPDVAGSNDMNGSDRALDYCDDLDAMESIQETHRIDLQPRKTIERQYHVRRARGAD